MSSSTSTGERRWASARRGGMTVLGKVAAPKPLNLPSQRLENHGLDPSVEIVPKGTLSWGSRSSSSSSNAWISSSNAGGTTSPSHLSGRPSSGGSGTRPSTAGSDRTHEGVASAWGPNSRPSSASGKLLSNQTSSTPLRPRSAETRPNSSQLSRFAEPVSESSVAWGPSITAERLGVKSSKEDGFSLSSGDFPTLGSEKDHSGKTIESEDYGRPSSASGRISQAQEDTNTQTDVKRGTGNTWRTDGPRRVEDNIHPSMEKWQADQQQHFNPNIPPQHFDGWRGPPINAPAGIWYQGRPPGPPFGAPLGPGGFPMEPFPYYRPQIPPPPLAGSQQVPPPGSGPRGPHPKNGDLYRPQMPDNYARGGMPFRPGFYPRPTGLPGPMAFEGYYGPPIGYCNNERDIPYMSMTAAPPVYNGYPGPGAPDIGNSHGRAGGRGPAGKKLTELVEGDHFDDKQGPRRVHLKNHDEWDLKEEGENWEHDMQPNIPNPGKSYLPMVAYRNREWGAEVDTEEDMFSKRTAPSERSSRGPEYRGRSSDGVKVKSFQGMGNARAVDDNWTNKSENVASFPPVMTQPPLASERGSPLPASTKDPALMQKIEGLNAKVRVSDGRNDAPSAFNKEEQMSSSQHEVIVPVGDKPILPMSVMSRRSYHGGPGRVDHSGKGKFNGQDGDGWRRKPLTPESPSGVTSSKTESNIHVQGPSFVGENSMIDPAGNEGDSSAETYDDSTDIQAQRAKMRELAKQRALQLQKEEEERTKEQKAKALAKLEELNRRTLSGEVGNQKAEGIQVVSDTTPGEQEPESHTLGDSVMVDPNFQQSSLNLRDQDIDTNESGESVEVPGNLPLEMQQTIGLSESDVSHRHASPIMHDDSDNGNTKKVASYQLNDGGGTSRHKRTGYKQKHQNNSLQKSLNEKSVSSVVASEAPKDRILVGTIDITSSEAPLIEIKPSGPNVPNPSNSAAHQRRKNNRNSKNKHKLDENPSVPVINLGKDSIETDEPKASLPNPDSSTSTVIEDGRSSLPNEESQRRVTNQWKPQQPSRRMPRSQQPNRFVDKLHGSDSVKWAPVSTQNKANKGSDEASKKYIQELCNPTKGGDNNMAQNSSKGKRAEMERYVPKPVAKELAQQGSVPPLSFSIRSDEGPGKEPSGLVSSASPEPVNSSVETNEGDGKHKKEQVTWQQRGSTDSSHIRDIRPSKEHNQSVKHEINLANAEIKTPGVVNTSDGNNFFNSQRKDQGATVRGKRYLPRVPRSTGNNSPDPENIYSGEIDANCVQSDVNHHTDKSIVSKENRSFGERISSQWQPKSYSNNQHGSRSSASESVTMEINRLPKKDHKVQVPHRHEPHPGQSSVKSNVAEESILGNPQDSNREKKPAPVKGRPYSPNQEPAGSTESDLAGKTNELFERNISSGSRRNWTQNSRYVKSHESRGDWSAGASRERPRQSVHYEYQPVGPYKDTKPEKANDPSENVGTRYRERGHSNNKRGGNFHKRQSGAAVCIESGRQE